MKEKHPMDELAEALGQLIFWSVATGILLFLLSASNLSMIAAFWFISGGILGRFSSK